MLSHIEPQQPYAVGVSHNVLSGHMHKALVGVLSHAVVLYGYPHTVLGYLAKLAALKANKSDSGNAAAVGVLTGFYNIGRIAAGAD